MDPNPEIILVNNKIYQRRGFYPLYDYVEMYVDPKDKTLKSYSYILSLKHHFPKEFSEGKVKSLSYEEASQLAQENTDEKGYIWIPEIYNDSPVPTPQEVQSFKDKAELAQNLWRGLVTTFDALNVDQNLKDSVNNLLVDQSFNLRIETTLENLTDFTFNARTIESKRLWKQEIAQIEVQWKSLIITLKNEDSLVFTPPKG